MKLTPIGAREAVVLILSASVAASLLSLAIAASIAEGTKDAILSEAATSLLSTVLGAAIGVLAAYISRGDVSAGADAGRSRDSAAEAAGDEAAGGPPK